MVTGKLTVDINKVGQAVLWEETTCALERKCLKRHKHEMVDFLFLVFVMFYSLISITPRPSKPFLILSYLIRSEITSLFVRSNVSFNFHLFFSKEVIKEQPTSRNLSATAARVPQCTRTRTCPVAASRIYSSAIHTSHHLTSNPHT